MTGYERILKAVRYEHTDRLPIDYSATPEAHSLLKAHLGIDDDEKLLRRIGCDIRRVEARFVGPSDMNGAPGVLASGKDFWGIVRQPIRHQFGSYNEFVYQPLADAVTVAEIQRHTWPSVDWFDYSHLSEQIDRLNNDGRYCILLAVGNPFETAWYLRGMSRFLMDLVEAPDIAEAICRHVTDFYTLRAMKALEQARGKIDMVLSASDVGTQRGMMISPAMWRKHVKSITAELISPFKRMGLLTMYHSCGGIVPIVDDLIEMGLDILDPVQPSAEGMAPSSLAARFGGRIAFHGGIDEQHLLPHGSAADVRREVARAMDILGHNGGYIVCPAHAIQGDTPPENVVAMYDTVWGR